MAKTTLGSGHDGSVATGTKYISLGVTRGLVRATETDAQMVYRSAGTFTKMFASVGTNAATVATTLKTRKNATDGSLSISVGAAATGQFTDVTNSDTVTAGDKFNYSVSGHDGTISFPLISVVYTVTGKAVSRGASYYSNITDANKTIFTPLMGITDPYVATTTTEANAQWVAKYTGTISNLFANVISNAATDNDTVKIRKNAADGTQSVSITALTTGFFEDTSNTDGFVSGDTVNYSYTRGASVLGTTMWVGCNIEDAITSKGVTFGFADEFSNAQTNYSFSGSETSTETQIQNSMQHTATGSNLQAHVRNNGGVSMTITSRKNTAAGAMSISVGASSTGSFVDDTNSDTLAINDEYGFKNVSSGSGLWDMDFIGLVIKDTTVAPTTTVSVRPALLYMGVG